MKGKSSTRIITPLVMIGLLLYFGFGIGMTSPVTMPGYALVFPDDLTKTYIALPCLQEWQRRPDSSVAIARRGTATEAWKLHYKPDEICAKSGAFYSNDDRSVSGFPLEKIGILSPSKHWWDAPYSTEDGFVQPHG